MLYSVLAAITALLHGSIVVILFAGVFLAVFDKLKKWPVFEKLYLASAILMILSFIFTQGCFLTSIEQWLWKQVNSPFYYPGGCISHYLGFMGIKVADQTVYWLLVLSLVLGLGAYVIRFGQKNLLIKR